MQYTALVLSAEYSCQCRLRSRRDATNSNVLKDLARHECERRRSEELEHYHKTLDGLKEFTSIDPLVVCPDVDKRLPKIPHQLLPFAGPSRAHLLHLPKIRLPLRHPHLLRHSPPLNSLLNNPLHHFRFGPQPLMQDHLHLLHRRLSLVPRIKRMVLREELEGGETGGCAVGEGGEEGGEGTSGEGGRVGAGDFGVVGFCDAVEGGRGIGKG